jgi:hypothetical protein
MTIPRKLTEKEQTIILPEIGQLRRLEAEMTELQRQYQQKKATIARMVHLCEPEEQGELELDLKTLTIVNGKR